MELNTSEADIVAAFDKGVLSPEWRWSKPSNDSYIHSSLELYIRRIIENWDTPLKKLKSNFSSLVSTKEPGRTRLKV